MKNSKITVFYTPKMVTDFNIHRSYTKSPLKPMLLMKSLESLEQFNNKLDITEFSPFEPNEFEIAHTKEYVEDFFNGEGECSSNNIPWSPEFAETVKYTNASLYHALRHAVLNPLDVCLSPTAGFHHAMPENGSGFCTFSGQVIAAVKIYEEFRLSGAVLDLDGHFGNSIEDSRDFVPDLNKAIPLGYNINPTGINSKYLEYLKNKLRQLENSIMVNNSIHYIMWCHGADSHRSDDLLGQCDTEHWVECSNMFYSWLKALDEKLIKKGRAPMPVVISLFGGYRKDDYASVISLHIKDLAVCLNTLCGANIEYKANVAAVKKVKEDWKDGMPISVLNLINKTDVKKSIKTLVIHPQDVTTDFLKIIYSDKDWTVINHNVSTKILKQQIKEHDKIIMLGHGTEEGLLGFNRFMIDSSLVYMLRDKDCVCIWCNADVFVNKYELKGFYTGMIISEYEEAIMYSLHDFSSKHIEESNKLFSDSVKHSIDKLDVVYEIRNMYIGDDNPIINFNKNNLYYR